MSYLLNNQQKLNEIIFAQRNKNYGAYELRSAYGNTVFKSLAYMMLGFGSLVLISYYLSNKNDEPDNQYIGQLLPDTSTYVVEYKTPEPDPDPKEKTKAPAPAKNTEVAGTSTVVSDTVITEVKQTVQGETVAAVNSSVGTSDGNGTSIADSSGGTGTIAVAKRDTVIPPYGLDSEPEFDGGLKALYRFLSSNLHYPDRASLVGIGGTVHVKFVVDEKGQVSRLSILNSIGYGLDEEAIRVVSMIPRFKTPAKVNGRAVKTYYQLPIKFSPR